MTHSPLPWRKHGNVIVDANGTEIMDYVHVPADQSIIVQAVNAHASLVAALEAISADDHCAARLAELRIDIRTPLELAKKVTTK